LAGGCYGAACYRHVVHPPVYGAVVEKVVLQPPQVFARTIPGEYASYAEKTLIAPPGKVWQVTRDAYGRTVGCWVPVPARYAVQHRRVMVRPPQVVQDATPGIYGTLYRKVLVQPAQSAWEPIGGYGAGYGFGSVKVRHRASAGFGVGVGSSFVTDGYEGGF
jgi:hypothetical protein